MKRTRQSTLIKGRLCLVIGLIVSFFLAPPVYSGAQKKYDLRTPYGSLTEVFSAIQAQTNYRFLYSHEDVAGVGKNIEAMDFTDSEIDRIMNSVLRGTGLTWQISGENLISVKKSAQARQAPAEPITGLVRGANGDPIAGVNIIIKETTRGTTTNALGRFTITPTSDEPVILVFSFVGMETKEVKAQSGRAVNVTMEDAATTVRNLVVTGLYTRNMESFTGSASTFTGQQIRQVGPRNVLQSLGALDPSFVIVENNFFGSDPNRMPDIEIQGKTSVIGLTDEYGTDPNQPLFILDGFETSLQAINDLSPDRVASITILKDATSTAIYGSKAANGVVVVETVRPESGQLRVSYNTNVRLTWADLTDYSLMNSEQKLEYEKLTGRYGFLNADGTFSSYANESTYNESLKLVRSGIYTYWPKYAIRFGTSHSHNLMVEGGDEYLVYGVGINYQNTTGVMKGSDRDVFNGNVQLRYRRGRISFSNQLNINSLVSNNPAVSFSEFVRANPYLAPYDENGELISIMGISYRNDMQSPLWNMTQNNRDRTNRFGITNNFMGDVMITPNFKAQIRFGFTKYNEKNVAFTSPFHTKFRNTLAEYKGEYSKKNNDGWDWNGSFYLSYAKSFIEKHTLNLQGGVTADERYSTGSSYTVKGFTDDMFINPLYGFGFHDGENASHNESKNRKASYLAILNYDYDRRYLMDATYRMDGSSTFGSDNLFSHTYSVGAAWNLHNENFFPQNRVVNHVKLRATVGNPGNQNFSDYISSRIYEYKIATNLFGPGVMVDNFGNDELKWQKTIQTNFGLDIEFLNGRIRATTNYYIKNTDPLLVYYNTAASTGVSRWATNLGKQYTQGIDFTLNAGIIQKEDFRWSAALTIGHQKSEYRKIGDALQEYNRENQGTNLQRYYDGGSPNDLWAMKSNGIDPGTGREVFVNLSGYETFEYDYDQERVVGNTQPKARGNISSNFYWKGFSLNVNFQYSLGGDIFLRTLYERVEQVGSIDMWYNLDSRALTSRWKQPGDVAKFKAIDSMVNTNMSSRFVKTENFIRMAGITLTYQLPTSFVRRLALSSMDVGFNMVDLFRISTVKEERGIDYPFSREVSFSLGLRF